MQIIRYQSSDGTIAPGLLRNGQLAGHFLPGIELHDLLHLRIGELRTLVENSIQMGLSDNIAFTLLAPIDGETEVWAAGVTYKRSEEARMEESGTPDIYARVYTAQRPELFFKANPRRVAGPGAPIAIRADSTWDVPEPELALVINASGEIIGYTIANDMSSRSIEGENPLYLPQAKVYANCCALGPGITPTWEIPDPYNLTIGLTIEREGHVYWQGETSTGALKRRFDELVSYLFLENDFPDGAILCTGTGLVPESQFTLQPGDIVQITINPTGILRNPVVRGKGRLQ
ncbi:MAG TPA: fumarylacetoacetate hydrolase family protein [Ktedonobacteraceae bacterium]|nr:fumarylacetoacetate hydrolase family protein [Ktedonobacteraceae bacterium]